MLYHSVTQWQYFAQASRSYVMEETEEGKKDDDGEEPR